MYNDIMSSTGIGEKSMEKKEKKKLEINKAKEDKEKKRIK